MIDFRTPQPSDKAWVDALLAQADYRGCDYNFTNLFVWSRAYGQEIAQVNGFLVTHLCGRMGCSYMYPAGSGDLAADRAALVEEYNDTLASVFTAASDGVVDMVIDPAATRAQLINALEMLAGKRVSSLPKKHSNMPL